MRLSTVRHCARIIAIEYDVLASVAEVVVFGWVVWAGFDTWN